ncbi:interferon-induced very large GTPase 1-like [Ochotona curzoniae]|uniref:interferon-induced very large GTPase 1-like n=1 Tax=Ochotona curzoniae TaxID=130825 RepID=UPI001B34B5CF|nr:interferon-induced very large GTPase 1-like [Ochotona curzoniae]
MDSGGYTRDKQLLREEREQDLQERLRAVGLNAEYWLPKLQEHLGVTSAQALQHLDEEDLHQLKSQTQHLWEKRALEKLLHLSQSGLSGSKQAPVELMYQKQMKHMRMLLDGDYEATKSSLQMDKVENQLESLFHGKKQSEETHEHENSERKATDNGPFLDILQQLGLDHYYPKRMSRADFHVIYKKSVYNTHPSSEKEFPFYFLQKLLMLDYSLRHLVVRDDRDTKYHVDLISPDQDNETFDPYEEFIEDNPSSKPSSTKRSQLNKPHIHPMDIQMTIFHCVDDFARQYIMGKLAICQFALPLVVPNPCSSQIEFSLWSLRQIRKSWQVKKSPDEKISYRNQQICSVSTPIVSFIRVGNGLLASKSQIMNSFLDKRKNSMFFHRHCRGSTKDCLLMEGVVEVSWYCPGGDDGDRFNNCVTFTNLHGDAKEHKRQLTFLQEISSLIVVLMKFSDINEENRKLIRDLSQSPKPFILLLDDKEKGICNSSSQRVRIGIRNRNEAELTEEIATAIRHLLDSSDTSLSLEDCSMIARQQGFLIDEDERECKEGKEKAQNVMSLLSETALSHVKENFLPLQGTLWHQWCKKDRELYHLTEKGNRSIEQHKSDTQREKREIRQKQLIKAFPLNDLMRSVLDNLQGNSENHTKHYFLPWLSVFLDDLTAGCVEQWHEKQRPLLPQVQEKEKTMSKKNYLQDQQSKMGGISTENHNCVLGVEQLFREVGQIYEALKETSSKKEALFHSLPEIAADLMISGVPIELMDGDASYVPLTWIAAVFDKLAEKLGDKKLFVLSIIGLQSSGKSTLLNTLFGLQFTVSAGRCTRGAYMQLLKVEETFTGELGFDFVLAVDTEGLRAPELNNKSQNRDNELATFVTGLGNLTLINIFGENPSEMQDILQIVVQAFLRMKQVKISPSCIFIHQNVEDVAVEDQLIKARRKLVQRLDEMAKLAAEQEQYSDITCFNDVIKFDVTTQVYYFAHLWDGNPPMAPPNPRYSLNVQELRSKILMSAKQEFKGSIMKISDLKFRVQDLWKALVSENFIFSFKNTLEVVAMSKLETMYNQWTWELRSHVLDLQLQLNNQIKNGKMQTLNRSTVEAPVTEKYEAIKQEFEKFLTEDPDNGILIQWKANFEHKLSMLKDTLVSESLRKADELIHFKKSQEKLDKKKAEYERELLEKSRKLALSIKDKELNKEEVQNIFYQLWTKWVHDVSSTFPQVEEPDIELDAEDILLNYFKSETNIVETLGKKSGKVFQMDYTEYVKMSRNYSISRDHLEAHDKEAINRTSNHIFTRFEETIKDIRLQQRDYSSSDFHKILRIIEEEVESETTAKKYSFTNKYKIDMSLHLFRRASQYFKKMHEAFKRANNPVYYLESKKADFFMSFEISIQGATSIKTFVDFLWNKLSPAVSKTIREKAVPKIAGDMRNTCPEFNGNRANLEKHILISLAEEENFEKYWQYIHYPKSFFRSYIETQIRKYCSGSGAEAIQAFLKLSLDDIKNVLLSAIHKSTAQAKDKSSTASEWLDLFCDHLGSNLIFPRSDLISIEHQEIKDMEFLKEAMSADLDPAMETVEQNCLSIPVEEFIPAIEKILSEHLCGCWKQCPFCKAICTNTISAHDGDHSVPFHRPQAVSGWHWLTTDNLTIDCCTSLVASDCSFLLSEDEKFPYKNYRQAGGDYATWSITPDSSSQPYWKWFVSHFRSNLEEKYQKRFAGKGQIPDEWARITKQEVLDDLKTQ